MISLMYHDIVPADALDSSGFPGRDAGLYKVAPETFLDHLRAICALGQPVTLTFDDGGASAMRAAELLEAAHVRGRFFITSNFIGSRGFVDRRDLCDLHARGHVVGSHSCSHPLRMGHCSRPRLLDEWVRSRSMLGDILGAAVDEASVPGGDLAPAVVEAAADAGYTRLFTSEPSAVERTAFGITIRGRYAVQRWTSAATVAGLVSGAWLPTMRQRAAWRAKKVAKRIGGERYLQLRRLLLRHGRDVRWGDAAPGK
jgi:peptidoglycan/xylan/chitin deacetylase (PgdA/CDA1 family)